MLLPVAIAFGVAFAIFPLRQAWTNYRYLGGSTRSGYVFWVPEVYGSLGKTFSARFLFGATMPGNPYGNVLSYALTLSGLDGMLGDPGDPRYLMYPFAAAVFAIIGIVAGLKSRSAAPLHAMWFGLAFLAAMIALYLFYFFTEIAFVLPATFILFAAAGYGIVAANRAMLEARTRPRKSYRDNAVIAGVVALDLVLAVSIVAETADRVAASPAQSKMVGMLCGPFSMPPGAIVVSNVSLQFLELYVATVKTELSASTRSIRAGSSPTIISRACTRKGPPAGPVRCRRFFLAALISMTTKRKLSATRFVQAGPRIFL